MNYNIKSPFNYAGTKQNTLTFLFEHFPEKKVFVDKESVEILVCNY